MALLVLLALLLLAVWWARANAPPVAASSQPFARSVADPQALLQQSPPAAGAAASTRPVPAAPELPPPIAPSLADTVADGAWPLDAKGQLQAHIALRRRFDYLLSQIGEQPLPALRTQLQALLARPPAPPPRAVAEILRLWDRYLALQQHAWRYTVSPREPHTWGPALAERQMVRRQLLGAAWAEAFYGAEERELQASLAALARGDTPAPVTTFAPPLPHPDAAAREATLAAQWRDWDGRLTAARAQWRRLQQAPELSALQRREAMDRYLRGAFSEAEQARAWALLGGGADVSQ